MKDAEIKNYIRSIFNLHHNQKIYLRPKHQEFSIRLGKSYIDIPYPVQVTREIKIQKILNEI